MNPAELTGRELMLIGGALSDQLRYAQRNLDKAREPDAIDRWAKLCTDLRALMKKLDEGR